MGAGLDEAFLYPVVHGRRLVAQFHVERDGSRYRIVLESRSGAKGSYRERNPDYSAGLEVILARLGSIEAVLVEVRIAPQTGLRDERTDARVRLERGYPVRIAEWDIRALRLAIQRASRDAALLPDARGTSNNQRRLWLTVELPLGDPGQPAVEAILTGGPAEDMDAAGWSPAELGLLAGAYVAMLGAQYQNTGVDPDREIRRLTDQLVGRSAAEIEARLGEMSAWLQANGHAWIGDLAPTASAEADVARVFAGRLAASDVPEAARRFEEAALVAPHRRIPNLAEVLVPPPSGSRGRTRDSGVRTVGGPVNALRDFHKRAVGRAGERWVLNVERRTLEDAGRADLAESVEWTADELGDGFGYDIRSFRADGTPRLIEVKTTNDGLRTPFFITEWEKEVSRQRADEWALYRVHGFATDPRIYVLEGFIEESAVLTPQVYLGVAR